MNATPGRMGLRDELSRLRRLTRKELSESLRDRRTVFTLVLMPLLLYPVLALAFLQMLAYKRIEKEWPEFRVGVPGVEVSGRFVPSEEALAILAYWNVGEKERLRRHTAGGKNPDGQPPPAFLATVPSLAPVAVRDLEHAVRAGAVDVGVRLRPPGPFRADPSRPLYIDCELLFEADSSRSHDAVRHLELLTADANAWQVGRGLRLMGVKQRGDPVRVRAVALEDEASHTASLLPVLMPLILILMTMTGAVYPAIDLTAGERERGTLEILVAAPIPRLSVLLAKYLAVLTVAMLTAVVNLGTMALTLYVTGIGPAVFGATLTPGVLVQVLALLLLFAAFFSAMLLTLTSFARTFKEAQAYLIPLMLLCLAPGIMALLPGLSLRGPLAVAPLVNIVLLSRDVLQGMVSPTAAGVVVLSTLLYALAAIGLATRIFGTEAVLSSEMSGWSDFFRRPTSPRPAAEPAGALLAMALLFPAYFLVTTGLGRLDGLDLGMRLVLASALNLLLFAGVPLVAVWRGNIVPATGLGLRRPPVLAVIVAILLGLSLWPFVHEVVLLFRQAGLATLPEELQKRSAELLVRWRQLPPALIVVAMALIPAVVEELFFRGFLLSALLGEDDRRTRAVVGSAALFAIFHLLVSDALAVERLVPSFLLGLMLGELAYRSGSVVPGMVLHLLHNGSIVLLGYYEPQLIEAGWVTKGQEHYPLWLLSSAAGLAVPGVVGLLLCRRGRAT